MSDVDDLVSALLGDDGNKDITAAKAEVRAVLCGLVPILTKHRGSTPPREDWEDGYKRGMKMAIELIEYMAKECQ